MPVYGQPDPDFWGPESLQTEQEEDLQRSHGSRVRLSGGLLPRHEVIITARKICSWCYYRRLSPAECEQPPDIISVYLPLNISFFCQLCGVWRCRWKAEHLGLEDHQTLPQDQGSWQGVHQRPLASTRDLQGHHLRLGRTDKTLGLDLSPEGKGLRRCGDGAWPELVVSKVQNPKSHGAGIQSCC